MFIPNIPCLPLHSWGFCSLYHFFPSQADVTKSPNLNYAETHNKILISDDWAKTFITGPWDDLMLQPCLASFWEFSSRRCRNPHWFLIRTCQVSIKEVPSPPLVSIEIRLTNKNSLAALFAQSGLLLLLCVWATALWGSGRKIPQDCSFLDLSTLYFFIFFKWLFTHPPRTHLYVMCTCTHYMPDHSIFVRQRVSSCCEMRTRWLLSETMGRGCKCQDGAINVSLRREIIGNRWKPWRYDDPFPLLKWTEA